MEEVCGKGDAFGGFGKGLKGFTHDTVKDLVAQSLLYGAIGFLGTMADVESAELAGDSYPMAECLIVDETSGTMIGARRSIYGTTMYIGHPVHKALGAKIGYSMLNGAIFFILFTSGIFASLYEVIPLCANGAILIFVGLLLGRQGFENTPRRHYPALLLGLMPFIANIMSLSRAGITPTTWESNDVRWWRYHGWHLYLLHFVLSHRSSVQKSDRFEYDYVLTFVVWILRESQRSH